MGKPLCNHDHNTIICNTLAGRSKPKNKNLLLILNFKNGNYTQMRKLVRKRLNGGVKKVKGLQGVLKPFKH